MDKYLFSYATASDPPIKRGLIRLVEKATGQPKLKRIYMHNQRFPRADQILLAGGGAVARTRRPLRRRRARGCSQDRPGRVRRQSPVWRARRHRDGVAGEQGQKRFRRPHPCRADARAGGGAVHSADRFLRRRGGGRTNLASRAAARAQPERGGAVVVFPAGAISTAPDKLGLKPAVDGRWQPFVSQLIQRSEATVVPIWFGGQNGRSSKSPVTSA